MFMYRAITRGWLDQIYSKPKVVIYCLITLLIITILLPLLAYHARRIVYLHPIGYNEGWNALHTVRFLGGKALYQPIAGFPLTPVNYPPLSFVIIGGLSSMTGDILLTGRAVSLISFLFIGYLIFKIILNLTNEKWASVLGAFIWFGLMVQVSGYYVGLYDPQMLAHVFSLAALCLYTKWTHNLTFEKTCFLALLCFLALFIKHLVIAVPLTLAITLCLTNKKAFVTFSIAGMVIFSLLLLLSRVYGGEYFFANFIDLVRPVSGAKLREQLSELFQRHFIWIFFLPFVLLLFKDFRSHLFTLTYFGLSFLLGSYVIRGLGVDKNAWFEFFIAAAIVYGLFVARSAPSTHRDSLAVRSSLVVHAVTFLSLSTILLAVLANEFVLARTLSSDGVLERSTLIKIRIFQLVLAFSGAVLFAGRRWVHLHIRHLIVYAILACTLLPFGLRLFPDPERLWSSDDELNRQETAYLTDVQLLQKLPGPVLTEELLLAFDAGKEFLFDPFAGTQMIASGRAPEQPLIQRICSRYFAAIVLYVNPEKIIANFHDLDVDSVKPVAPLSTKGRWTLNTLRAINANYELSNLNPRSRYFFYMPRKNGSASSGEKNRLCSLKAPG